MAACSPAAPLLSVIVEEGSVDKRQQIRVPKNPGFSSSSSSAARFRVFWIFCYNFVIKGPGGGGEGGGQGGVGANVCLVTCCDREKSRFSLDYRFFIGLR